MGKETKMYDLIGVGIGPFNLSLAALLDEQPGVDTLFFEQKRKFEWHPGMLIEGTKMQVPFLADLVTMADPTNKHSFLNYITEKNRMYQFYFLQRLDIPRREYNHYCQWAAERIESCQFGKRIQNVIRHKNYFEVEVLDVANKETLTFATKNLVLGTGSVPAVPSAFEGLPNEDVFHTAHFLNNQDRVRNAKSVTVIGSGQSAAEVFRELLKEQNRYDYRLDWITRSKGFSSMEESKLSLEHFSPDYVNYFYHLPQEKKESVFASQDLLYKGISAHTTTDLYNILYEQTVGDKPIDVGMQVLTEVNGIERNESESAYNIKCRQWQVDKEFTHESEVVILATGYRPYVPSFIHDLGDFLEWDEKGRYRVEADYRLKTTEESSNEIYVHSGISHTHGVGSTNLGLAVHRNKVIINQLMRKEVFKVNDYNVFQTFNVN